MNAIDILKNRGAAAIDTQTVTTGSFGVAPNRFRGFANGSYGSIVDGTSNIYVGAAIQVLEWEENGGGGAETVVLFITGATNTGWTSLTIDGTITLLRTAASFSANTWTWAGQSINPFGLAASVHTCVFT